jgi:hypothetical protein
MCHKAARAPTLGAARSPLVSPCPALCGHNRTLVIWLPPPRWCGDSDCCCNALHWLELLHEHFFRFKTWSGGLTGRLCPQARNNSTDMLVESSPCDGRLLEGWSWFAGLLVAVVLCLLQVTVLEGATQQLQLWASSAASKRRQPAAPAPAPRVHAPQAAQFPRPGPVSALLCRCNCPALEAQTYLGLQSYHHLCGVGTAAAA